MQQLPKIIKYEWSELNKRQQTKKRAKSVRHTDCMMYTKTTKRKRHVIEYIRKPKNDADQIWKPWIDKNEAI